MHSTRQYSFLAIFIAVAAFVFFFFAGEPYSERHTIGRNVKDFKELSDRFTVLAQEKGGEYAFEILNRVSLPPQTDLHLLGHVVGDELYRQQGVDGIGVCTQDFRNACSHSIVIGALNEFGGKEALELIREACKKAPGGLGAYTMCYHGLGHGVFAFYKYDLEPAVAFCRETGTEQYHDEEYIQCVGGAAMELMGGGGHDREEWLSAREKYLSKETPLSPCMDGLIPERAKAMCLVYITPRLLELAGAALGNPDPMYFGKAAAFCDAIPRKEQKLRDACFGGFGKEFIPLAGSRDIRKVDQLSDEQFETAISWCDRIQFPDGQEACIADAVASIFWGGENDPDASFRFCALVEGESARACYERLAGDIQRYAGSRIFELCNRVPEKFRNACADSS